MISFVEWVDPWGTTPKLITLEEFAQKVVLLVKSSDIMEAI
jgi:hypothetical protein